MKSYRILKNAFLNQINLQFSTAYLNVMTMQMSVEISYSVAIGCTITIDVNTVGSYLLTCIHVLYQFTIIHAQGVVLGA